MTKQTARPITSEMRRLKIVLNDASSRTEENEWLHVSNNEHFCLWRVSSWLGPQLLDDGKVTCKNAAQNWQKGRDNVPLQSVKANSFRPLRQLAEYRSRFNMQNDERNPALKLRSEDLKTCPCNACFPRKDFTCDPLTSHVPRELYNHNSVVGLGPQIPILPYSPIPSSPASLYAPLKMHRPSYTRALFPVPESRYIPGVQDISKRRAIQESQMVERQALQPNSEATGNYWEQPSGEYVWNEVLLKFNVSINYGAMN